jgi:hypothetical protein
MGVLKQRAIFNLMHAIKQFEKIREFDQNLKNLGKITQGFVTFNFTFCCKQVPILFTVSKIKRD